MHTAFDEESDFHVEHIRFGQPGPNIRKNIVLNILFFMSKILYKNLDLQGGGYRGQGGEPPPVRLISWFESPGRFGRPLRQDPVLISFLSDFMASSYHHRAVENPTIGSLQPFPPKRMFLNMV